MSSTFIENLLASSLLPIITGLVYLIWWLIKGRTLQQEKRLERGSSIMQHLGEDISRINGSLIEIRNDISGIGIKHRSIETKVGNIENEIEKQMGNINSELKLIDGRIDTTEDKLRDHAEALRIVRTKHNECEKDNKLDFGDIKL